MKTYTKFLVNGFIKSFFNVFFVMISLVFILNILKMKSLIRCNVNYYPKTHTRLNHSYHTDFPFKHKGAIFYINDNDGLTILEDGTEVKSVANSLLLFDASRPHHSTTCTNTTRRLNININYF